MSAGPQNRFYQLRLSAQFFIWILILIGLTRHTGPDAERSAPALHPNNLQQNFSHCFTSLVQAAGPLAQHFVTVPLEPADYTVGVSSPPCDSGLPFDFSPICGVGSRLQLPGLVKSKWISCVKSYRFYRQYWPFYLSGSVAHVFGHLLPNCGLGSRCILTGLAGGTFHLHTLDTFAQQISIYSRFFALWVTTQICGVGSRFSYSGRVFTQVTPQILIFVSLIYHPVRAAPNFFRGGDIACGSFTTFWPWLPLHCGVGSRHFLTGQVVANNFGVGSHSDSPNSGTYNQFDSGHLLLEKGWLQFLDWVVTGPVPGDSNRDCTAELSGQYPPDPTFGTAELRATLGDIHKGGCIEWLCKDLFIDWLNLQNWTWHTERHWRRFHFLNWAEQGSLPNLQRFCTFLIFFILACSNWNGTIISWVYLFLARPFSSSLFDWRQRQRTFISNSTDDNREPSAFFTLLGGKPGPKSRRFLLWLLFFNFCLVPMTQMLDATHSTGTRGEGCISPMGDAGTSNWTYHFLQKTDVKQHGTQPTMRDGAQHVLNHSASKIVKRSLKRAQRRAQTNGFAWYKGRCMLPADFAKMGMQPVPETPPGTTADVTACHQRHAPRRRLTCLAWNSGGLSAPRLDEVKAWLTMQQIQLAVISETRWSFQTEWSDSNWHHVHSADPNSRGSGVLILISRRFCDASQIRWTEPVPGRLLHVRILMTTRNFDVLGCYQHVHTGTKRCFAPREAFWKALEQQLLTIPNRNTLVALGDLTAASRPLHLYVGPLTSSGKAKSCRAQSMMMLNDFPKCYVMQALSH